MLLFLLGYFALCATIALVEYRLREGALRIIFPLMMLLLAIVIGLRPEDLDADHSNYISLYNNQSDEIGVEFTFRWISALIKALGDKVELLFLTYALISLGTKYFTIKRYVTPIYLTLLIYFSTSCLLHDFNQIRAGSATSFLLLAFSYLHEGERRRFLLFTLIATLFHYSAAAAFLVLFMDRKPMERWQYILYGSIIPMAYVMYFLSINIFYMIPIPYLETKMEAYEALQTNIATAWDVNVFNLVLLVRILILYFLLTQAQRITAENKYFPILLKLDILSIASFVVFHDIPVLSFRISELFGVVEIVLFPMIYYIFRPQWLSTLLVIQIAAALFTINLFFSNYLIL